MKTNKAIEASKQKVVAWGDFLLNTFRKLGIADNEVIRNCHVGRNTFYRMKRGELINVDAYLRMTGYADMKTREQVSKRLLSGDFVEEWWKLWWKKCIND